MPKQIIIAEQHRIAAVFSEDRVQELIVATGSHQVGDIYLGVVENVLPGIDAAFVNIGDSERNGFIHVSDLGPLRLRKTAGSITELLAPQQKVLVQVMKEPTGNKGPRLTGKVSLPGRYLVLMPFGSGVNLSRRIERENERHRLRALAILIKPAGMGLLVRTEAEGVAEEAIMEDLEALQRRWESIQQEAASTRAPALLERDDDFIQRVLREAYTQEVNRVVVDSHSGMKRIKQQVTLWAGSKTLPGVSIDHHRERSSILEYFRVNAAIREALKPRVDLPSGGYIIIEPTEALTVIDVNSGSFTRSATARETVLWTNCEAATEIARQLRLRNLAGVIVVDFIDMESHRDRLQVLEHFSKALKSDKARPQIAQLSELGLVELTRKRQGQNIYELFGRACPTCGGLGMLAHLPDEAEDAEPVSLLPNVESGDRRSIPMLQKSRSSVGSRRSVSRSRELPPAAAIVSLPSLEDPLPNLQDLDLSNHPNYQESLNGSNSRRRRRRRGGNDEPVSRRGAASLPVAAEPEVDEAPLDPPTVTAAAAQPSPAPAAQGRNGRPERSRGRSARTAEPREAVAVTMTSEEQEVYAWMGVSPLLLSDRQPENPESAIVSVLLPGQTAPPVPAPQPVADSIDPAEKDSPAPAAAEPVPTESLPLNISNGHGAEDPPSGLPEIVSVTPGGDANGRPRRRRRRSSTRA
jgi:ribonuclease E